MVRSNWKQLSAVLVVGAGLVLTLVPGAQPLHAADGAQNPCPPEMAFTAGVCMDRYEARLLERADDGKLTPFSPVARPKQGVFMAESRAGVRPQAYISQLEAASACQNAGKRLCNLGNLNQQPVGRIKNVVIVQKFSLNQTFVVNVEDCRSIFISICNVAGAIASGIDTKIKRFAKLLPQLI